MIEFDPTTARRLPVYLVLDTSGSMSGDGIEAVNQGVQLVLTELKGDPLAIETAWISCITFSSHAQQILPLTEVGAASIPVLTAGGGTNLGEALRLLQERLATDVRSNTPEQKGDYKPLVFLMSDGQPTDETWPSAAAEMSEQAGRMANVIALACGHDINTEVLKQISPTVLLMADVTPDSIRSFFKWVSHSVRVISRTAGGEQSSAGAIVNLPPPPAGIQIVI